MDTNIKNIYKYKKSKNIYRLPFVSYVIHNHILFILKKKKKNFCIVSYKKTSCITKNAMNPLLE